MGANTAGVTLPLCHRVPARAKEAPPTMGRLRIKTRPPKRRYLGSWVLPSGNSCNVYLTGVPQPGTLSMDALQCAWDVPPSPAWPAADAEHYQRVTFPEICRAVAILTGQRVAWRERVMSRHAYSGGPPPRFSRRVFPKILARRQDTKIHRVVPDAIDTRRLEQLLSRAPKQDSGAPREGGGGPWRPTVASGPEGAQTIVRSQPRQEVNVKQRRERVLLWSRPQVAIVLGIHPGSVSRLEANEGFPIAVRGAAGKGSQYDPTAVFAWGLERERRKYAPSGATIDVEQARARRDQSTAELNEQRLAERAGNLVSRAQSVAEMRGLCRAITSTFLALPRRMVGMGLLRPDQESGSRALIRDVLTIMSGWDRAEVERVSAVGNLDERGDHK